MRHFPISTITSMGGLREVVEFALLNLKKLVKYVSAFDSIAVLVRRRWVAIGHYRGNERALEFVTCGLPE